jgi:molybdopterin/thiamine biosynthesis adenylyltransferase
LVVAERYIRNGFSAGEQKALQCATVSIIGCGGLGGRTAELLTRLGIGSLVLTDPDVFSESNLNRQLFCNMETLGQAKTTVVARELQKINPALHIHSFVQAFDASSVSGADIVIDALDSGNARKQLATLCHQQNIPLVHGAVNSWYGQVAVGHPASPLMTTLYPDSNKLDTPPNVLPMTVSLIASMQTAEVCKYILRQDSPLQKSISLQCDLLHCQYELINKIE